MTTLCQALYLGTGDTELYTIKETSYSKGTSNILE